MKVDLTNIHTPHSDCSSMSRDELRVSIVGDVKLREDPGGQSLELTGVAAVFFLESFRDALDRVIMQRKERHSFVDFYDEYSIVLSRTSDGTVQVREESQIQTIELRIDELQIALPAWFFQPLNAIEVALPDLHRNLEYHNFKEETIHWVQSFVQRL